jgi:hypothetical protein
MTKWFNFNFPTNYMAFETIPREYNLIVMAGREKLAKRARLVSIGVASQYSVAGITSP